jgi:hypothetical protein
VHIITQEHAICQWTHRIQQLKRTAKAIDPINVTLIGTMVKGMSTPTTGKVNMLTIAKIILFCGFITDATMVRYIDCKELRELKVVTTIGVDEVKHVFTFCSNGIFDAKPMMAHLRMIKVFLFYCMCEEQVLFFRLTEDEVINITKAALKYYCSLAYDFANVASVGLFVMVQINARIGIEANNI